MSFFFFALGCGYMGTCFIHNMTYMSYMWFSVNIFYKKKEFLPSCICVHIICSLSYY